MDSRVVLRPDGRQTGALKQAIPGYEQEMAKAEEALTSLLLTIPNVPYDLVPQGGSAEDNLVVKMGNWENKPMLDKLAAEGTIAIRDLPSDRACRPADGSEPWSHGRRSLPSCRWG